MTASALLRITRPIRCRARYVLIFFLAAALLCSAASARANPANGANAIDILGQFASTTQDTTPNYTQSAENDNNGSTPTALGMDIPKKVAVDEVNHDLYVSDTYNNRVLVYALNTDNSIPTASGGRTATYVLGQPTFGSNTSSSSQSGLNLPAGVAVDPINHRLYVADAFNNRVMVFNTASLSNGMNASYVLGQPTFTNAYEDTQSGMGSPYGLAYDPVSQLLYVSDYVFHRVTVYSTASLSNGENASYVLGQSSFTTGSANGGGSGTNQSGLNSPLGIALDQAAQLLYVADYNNNRVMVFNVAPGTIANGENASDELGQPSGGTAFTSSGHATTQSGMFAPTDISYDANNSRLFVADYANSRVLVFNLAPPNVLSNGMNAANVVGEPNFTTAQLTTTQSGFLYPSGVTYDPGSHHLFVTDGGTYLGGNNRVMIFEATAPGVWPPGYD